jgi:hypothetical protein
MIAMFNYSNTSLAGDGHETMNDVSLYFNHLGVITNDSVRLSPQPLFEFVMRRYDWLIKAKAEVPDSSLLFHVMSDLENHVASVSLLV